MRPKISPYKIGHFPDVKFTRDHYDIELSVRIRRSIWSALFLDSISKYL